MTSDPDVVLNAFDTTSETVFLLRYTLKLFLSMEEGTTREAYETSEESMFHLCASPGRLPAPIRDFIIWQRNALKLDDREITETQLPKGLKKKYPVKTMRLAEMESDAERIAVIEDCIAEQVEYFDKFNEVRAIIEATEDRYRSVEETILRAESMDDGLSKALKDSKQAMDDMLRKLTDLRADLEDSKLPDILKFKDTPMHAWNLMKSLSDINLKARDAIRKHHIAMDDDV